MAFLRVITLSSVVVVVAVTVCVFVIFAVEWQSRHDIYFLAILAISNALCILAIWSIYWPSLIGGPKWGAAVAITFSLLPLSLAVIYFAGLAYDRLVLLVACAYMLATSVAGIVKCYSSYRIG
jgi:hypothetical protein